MKRYSLAALLTLGAAALVPALAQVPASKTKSAPPISKTAPDTKASAGKNTQKDMIEGVVVGRVEGKTITWGEVIADMEKTDQKGLQSAVAQAIGTAAAEAMFGSKQQDHFSVSREEALSVLREHPNALISNHLEHLLTNTAIDVEATKEGVQPTSQDVSNGVNTFLKSLRDSGQIPKGVSDDQFLAQNKMSRSQLEANYRPFATALNLVRKDTVRKFGHPLGPNDLVEGRHILVAVKDPAPDASAADKSKADGDALSKANSIAEDIKSGKKTFEQAAKESSDDPGSKEQGGELGVMTKGMMLKEFEDAAFSAKPGEMTAPVKTKYGYHLILVEKKGMDIPAAERGKFIDNYERQQVPNYVQNLIQHQLKVQNMLASKVPQSPMAGGMPR